MIAERMNRLIQKKRYQSIDRSNGVRRTFFWTNYLLERESQVSKIKKIKVQNGRSFESYTHELKEDSDYFIQLFYAINNNKIKLIK